MRNMHYENCYDGGYVDTDVKPSEIKGSDNSRRKIIITNDGKVTKAKYFENEKLVCTGIATCHEDDIFDVFKGAELALERCKAKKTLNDQHGYRTASTNSQKFKDGDIVISCKLNQIKECLNWCKSIGIDISKLYDLKHFEFFVNYENIVFYMTDDGDLTWRGWDDMHSTSYRYLSYVMDIMSFDNFFKLPEGVSFE